MLHALAESYTLNRWQNDDRIYRADGAIRSPFLGTPLRNSHGSQT